MDYPGAFEFQRAYSNALASDYVEILGPVEFIEYPSSIVQGLPLSESDKAYLIAGLPSEAAPFLSFGPSDNKLLPDASEVYSDAAPGFHILGSTGYGDPICLAIDSGHIAQLDHERSFMPTYMNASVVALAWCLLQYCRSKRDGNWPRCLEAISTMDPRSVAGSSFWGVELQSASAS